MRSASKLGPLVAGLLLVACGESHANRAPPPVPTPTSASFGPPAVPVAPAASAPSTGLLAPPGRLGHYSSGDGSVGFVLDRNGKTPKLRMDGTTQIIEFEQEAKTSEHVDYLNRKEHTFLRFESNGGVTYVRGVASSDMHRDAGAESLRGGAGNTKTFPASPESSEPNVPKLRLGHYSSGDGMTGLVLDRTGPKPRLRVDDSVAVIELEAEPAPLGATSLIVPGKGAVLRIGTYGQVEYFKGNESITMRRDCDADALR